ncbi:unnamed protein product, partial [Strongylus vulgaris]
MSGDAAPRACHSFRRTYAALCDFYDQPYRDEVSWVHIIKRVLSAYSSNDDVEKIYAVNRLQCLRIEDFSHLLPKSIHSRFRDLLPITGVLQYSSYFTGFEADGIRMTSEFIDVIMSVLRKSRYLHHLQLRNCALPRDFVTLFASALQQNPAIPLESIDLSKNVLDDKKGKDILEISMQYMCSVIKQFVEGLTAKSNCGAVSNLTHLNLSTNVLKDD